MGLDIQGAEHLETLSRVLKQLGEKDMQREVTKAITKSAKPLKKNIKANVAAKLPQRGGFAKRAARTALPHRTRKTGQSVGVRIEAKPSHTTLRDPAAVDRGRIKRPVFGMPASLAPWQLQDVHRRSFSEPFEGGAPIVREEIVRAMDDVAGEVLRKL